MKKIDRKIEVRQLKEKINAILQEIGMSKSSFVKHLPKKVVGEGYKYKLSLMGEGHFPSLRQRYQYLLDLKNAREKMEAMKKQENENAI